jgi:signal transduction histidine kinase
LASKTTLTTLGRLAQIATRPEASRELAAALGVDALLLLVRDPELGVLLPAPGFPQTLRGGPAWRAFQQACTEPGSRRADATSPFTGVPAALVAHVGDDGTTLVLIGGLPNEGLLAELVDGLPLLSALLLAENAAQRAEGSAAVARTASRHAHDLATALEAARTDVQRALRETAELNERLREADRRKDEFLAMLAHELRNPMAAISSALGIMRLKNDEPPAVDRARIIIERQSQQLGRLVDDLLDVARFTQGKIVLRLEPVNVRDIARRAIDTTAPLVAEKGHTLHVQADAAAIWATADPTRLEQMITNLLTNAAKYTDPNGRIRLDIRTEAEEVLVRVTDSGIGIAPAMLQHVFEPFVQIGPTLERSHGGMGIGLTLVKRLAALHGGAAEVDSVLGEGSTFTLRIPALVDHVGRRDSPDPAPRTTPARRVLVVDDNLDSAEMVAELVTAWGHETKMASDGQAALEIAAVFRPDVVFLDIGLPGLDGYEVARRLRAMAATATSRIVAVSGYGTAEDRQKTKDAGFDAHLTKPVDLAALQQLLAT